MTESQEDDEEHESESDHVLGAASESPGQLVHRLVEGDVLEDLRVGGMNGRCLINNTFSLDGDLLKKIM